MTRDHEADGKKGKSEVDMGRAKERGGKGGSRTGDRGSGDAEKLNVALTERVSHHDRRAEAILDPPQEAPAHGAGEPAQELPPGLHGNQPRSRSMPSAGSAAPSPTAVVEPRQMCSPLHSSTVITRSSRDKRRRPMRGEDCTKEVGEVKEPIHKESTHGTSGHGLAQGGRSDREGEGGYGWRRAAGGALRDGVEHACGDDVAAHHQGKRKRAGAG